MNLTNELAKERNREAAERTLMAWIRTCLSLISFGFGLDKIIGAIEASRFDGSSHAQISVRLISIGFVVTGIVAMAAATRQHRQVLRRLKHDDFIYIEKASIATATALALTMIGLVALVLLIAGGMGAR